MHSWVFRHRARLRVVFGCASEPPVEPREPERRPVRRLKSARRLAARRALPGTVDRGDRDVFLRPMRPPAS